MKTIFITLTFLCLLMFYPIIFGQTFFFGDNYSLLVPGKIFTAMNIRQGRLPLWNPYLFLGQSWIGNLNESIVYPSTLLFVIFNPSVALCLTILIHVLLSGLGAYLLATQYIKQRWARLCAVSIWLLCAQWIATYNNLSVLQSASFISFVILACLQLDYKLRSIVTLSLFIVLQIAGGYPQYVLYSVLFGFILHVHREQKIRLLPFLIAGALALMLSAIYWMPFLSLLHSSTRSVQTTDQLTAGSLHPLELLNSVVPTIFDDLSKGMKWGPLWNRSVGPGLYISLFGLFAVLNIIVKKTTAFDRVCLFLLLGSISFAVSGFFGFSPLRFIPLFSSSRGSGLILLPAMLIVATWIGSALERLEIGDEAYKKTVTITTILMLVATIGFIGIAFAFPHIWQATNQLLRGRLSEGWHTVERDKIILMTIWAHLTVEIITFLLLIYFHVHKRVWLFLFVLIIDLRLATIGRILYAPATLYPTWAQIQVLSDSAIKKYQGNDRVLIANSNTPYTDFATYWDALALRSPFSNSFVDQTELKTYARLHEMQSGYTPDWNMVAGIRSLNGYAAFVPKDLDAQFNTTAQPSLNSLPSLSLGDQFLSRYGVRLYWLDTWYPRAEAPSTLTRLYSIGNYRLFSLPGVGRFRLEDGTPPAGLLVHEDPNTQEIQVQARSNTALLIADRYDIDWKATVNGTQQTIINDEGIRKIQIPAGNSIVRLQYRPEDFFRGVQISLITSFGLLFIFLKRIVSQKKD